MNTTDVEQRFRRADGADGSFWMAPAVPAGDRRAARSAWVALTAAVLATAALATVALTTDAFTSVVALASGHA
ncbi:hypothetical protein EDC65_1343 [Stella humosa]|uniref:Uncharacterized protein n=1 Tax=Stella humosa TaxID=94 RepID=A0A3N1M7B2_9PROT|nr:hypothetical protein [Stella humosa]ROP99560.1 hypothetical protein EDC65_1343 [Stella humosa]BBK31219.1 hypothetical protein STHU_18530 [Stella humosa]